MSRFRNDLTDGLLALLLLAFGLGGTGPAAHNQGIEHVGPWAYVFVIVAAVAVAFRRRLPLTVLGVVAAAAGLYLLSGYPVGPIVFSLVVALYAVAAHRPFRIAGVAAGTVGAVLMVCGWIGAGFGLDGVAPVVAWAAAPLAVGVTVRVRREQVRTSRRDQARRQADAERLRVAQEVHDVVSHGLAAIHMQAEIALHLLARQPEQAETALAAISRTSRESLDELRATLGAVRRGDLDDRTPVAGLARLDSLVDRTRSVGVPVSAAIEGTVTDLPAAVDLAAYRVVQEALTNVLRHAGTATVEVRLARRDGILTIQVSDTGRGGEVPDSGGHGLAGMRERVTALGGTLEAGPLPGNGFAVQATIPIHPDGSGQT